MQPLVDKDGNRIQPPEPTMTIEQVIERAIGYIYSIAPKSHVVTVIMRDKADGDHCVYTQDSIADVMKTLVELQEKYPAETTAH